LTDLTMALFSLPVVITGFFADRCIDTCCDEDMNTPYYKPNNCARWLFGSFTALAGATMCLITVPMGGLIGGTWRLGRHIFRKLKWKLEWLAWKRGQNERLESESKERQLASEEQRSRVSEEQPLLVEEDKQETRKGKQPEYRLGLGANSGSLFFQTERMKTEANNVAPANSLKATP
jgi:hypothetical protein